MDIDLLFQCFALIDLNLFIQFCVEVSFSLLLILFGASPVINTAPSRHITASQKIGTWYQALISCIWQFIDPFERVWVALD